MNEIELILNDPIQVQGASGYEDEDTLYFNAPTVAMIRIRTKMVGIATNALLRGQQAVAGIASPSEDGKSDGGPSKMDKKSYLLMLSIADDGEAMIKMMDVFDKLVFLDGICFVGDERQKMTKDYWANVSIDDKQNIIGEYLENFISPALATMMG